MATGGGHKKRGFLSVLGSGLANALDGILHKRDSAERAVPEGPVPGNAQGLPVEPTGDEPAADGSVSVKSTAAEIQKSPALPLVEEASVRPYADEAAPEESDRPETNVDARDGGVATPEPKTEPSEAEAPANETHEGVPDVTSPATNPTRSLADIDMLSLADLGIASFTRSSFERFGIYMVTELLLYRREELIELRGVTQKTISMIELRVTSRTGQPFHLQGSLESGTQPRRMTREEMEALDKGLSELKVSPLVARQLRKSHFFGCRQIAFTSRDELLDLPGIDLEATYELEEALGALLGVRVVLGCDRGEPPTVVEGEVPYDWRIRDGGPKEPAGEDAEEGPENKSGSIVVDGHPEGPGDESDDGKSVPSELSEDANVTVSPRLPDTMYLDLAQGPVPANMSSETVNAHPGASEDAPMSTDGQYNDQPDDDDGWDDVFGWDDYESEWDDSSKWDWIYGEEDEPETEDDKEKTPDYQSAVGISEWVSGQDDVSCRLLLYLLDGMTKAQAAAECKVPPVAVDSLISYGLDRRPTVREDAYSHAFKSYAMTLYEFIDIFGQPASTYRYLSLAYGPGGGDLRSMLDDPDISAVAKANLRHRLASQDTMAKEQDKGTTSSVSGFTTSAPRTVIDYASKVIAKTDVSRLDDAVATDDALSIHQAEDEDEEVGGEDELEALRSAIARLGVDGKEYATSFFYYNMPQLMTELGIKSVDEADAALKMAFFDDSDVEFLSGGIVRFGTADHDKQIESLLERLSPVSSGDLAWQYRALYGVEFDTLKWWLMKFERYRHGDCYDIRYERPAQELREKPPRLPSGSSPRDRLARAIMDLAEDGVEYSTNYFLHSLPGLAKELRASNSRHFNQVMRGIFEGSDYVTFPSGFFVHFGECDRELQIYNLMRELSPVTVEELRREYSKRYGVSMTSLYGGWFSCINKYMRGGVYSVEDDTGAVTLAAPVKDVAANNAEAMPPSGQNAMGLDALRRLREAIDEIAKDDTEYSTDFFYAELGDLIENLGIEDGAKFYDVVVEAYKDSKRVTFPQGKVTRAVWFGNCKRDAQMLNLIKELSPATLDELADAYEKRYGFSSYLVKWWYRKFKDYESGGVYRIEVSSSGESSERDDGTLGESVGNDVGFEGAHDDNSSPPHKPKTTTEVGPTREIAVAEEPVRQPRQLPNGRDSRTTIPSGSKQPKTALEWALGLEGLQRQIVQQILFGHTLHMVAGNARLSLEETSRVLIETIKQCPTVREDSFLIHFMLSKSMREFCNSTGEAEAVYHFLYWRNRARKQGAASDDEIEGGSSQAQPNYSEQRRQMRRAARAEDRAWRSGDADDGSKTSRDQSELSLVPASSDPTSFGGVENAATTPAPKPSRLAVERRVANEVDRIATMGREYAPAYFYRSLLSIMRDLGIHSDDELLDVMRHAYRRDPDVSFVEGNVIRFGKCDRRGQLEGFLAENPAATLDVFVSGYERKYGFGRMRVTRWLKEYGIDLPAGQPEDDPALSLIQGLVPIDLPDAGARGLQAQADKPPAVRRQRTVSRQTQMELPISTKRVGRVSRTTEYTDFLRAELTADCCDRRLVAERFRARFPDGPEDPFSEKMLWRLGFRAKGKKLLFREGIGYEAYFEGLIDSRVMFARGDAGFENAIFNDPQFRKIVRRKMRSFDIVEYEKDSFISTAHLCEQMGVAMEDIQGYSQDVVAQLRDRIGAPAPFTVWSLRNQYSIRHPLDALKTEGGMSDFVYETLFDIDPHVQCCTISKRRGFLETDGDFDTGNFIECLVEMNGPMEIDDLMDLLRDAYGIDYPELPLHHTISMSSLYYDDITDSVFNSRHEWEEMVNRELA